jgi:hypothetical protein
MSVVQLSMLSADGSTMRHFEVTGGLAAAASWLLLMTCQNLHVSLACVMLIVNTCALSAMVTMALSMCGTPALHLLTLLFVLFCCCCC